jgi:diguanylate cyclase
MAGASQKSLVGDGDAPTGVPQRVIRAVTLALSLMLAAYLASLFARPASQVHLWLDGWGVATFELVVSVLIVARGLVSAPVRRDVTLIGVGGCLWALGDFTNTYLIADGQHPSTPDLPNFFWAAFFPLAFAGVMVLMNRDVIRVTALNYLDGLLLLMAASTILIAFLFTPIQHATGEGTATVATNLVYPVLDLPVLCLILLGLVLSPADRRLRWRILAAAGLVNIVGDVIAVFPQMRSGILGNAINVAAWPTSLLLIAAAFWLAPGSGQAPRKNDSSGFWVPRAASLIALGILCVCIVSNVNRVGMGVALVVLVVSFLRFGLALRHSRQLTAERERELQAVVVRERNARDELEAIAEELRTQGQRAAFGTKLAEALEMVDEESEAYEVVSRAMH